MDRAGAYFRWCRLHLLGRAIQETLKKKKILFVLEWDEMYPRRCQDGGFFFLLLSLSFGLPRPDWCHVTRVYSPPTFLFFLPISRLPPPKRSSRSCEECQPDSFSFRVYKASPLRFKYLCYIPQRSLPVSLIHTGSLSFKCRLVSL